jgi:hypothetical protein
MMLVIDVPEMTEDELAELQVITATLADRMAHSVELRWFCQSPIRLNILRAEQVEETRHSDGFGGTIPMWRLA